MAANLMIEAGVIHMISEIVSSKLSTGAAE